MLLPYDNNPNGVSGIRLGTPIITKNGMGTAEIDEIAELVDMVLSNLKSSSRAIDQSVADRVRKQATALSHKFPSSVSVYHFCDYRPGCGLNDAAKYPLTRVSSRMGINHPFSSRPVSSYQTTAWVRALSCPLAG